MSCIHLVVATDDRLRSSKVDSSPFTTLIVSNYHFVINKVNITFIILNSGDVGKM